MKSNKENKPKWIFGAVILSTLLLIFFVAYLRLKPDKSFEGYALDSITFSPNGEYILLWDRDTINLIDVKTEEIVRVFEGHKCNGGLSIAIFSPDGKYILSTCPDDSVYLWEISTGKKRIFPVYDEYTSFCHLSFSHDGKYIIANGLANKIWNVSTGKEMKNYWLKNIQDFSSDGRFALSKSSEGLELWELDTRRKIRTYNTKDYFDYAFFSEGNQYVIVYESAKYTSIYAINYDNSISTNYSNSVSARVAISADGKFYAESLNRDYFTLEEMSAGIRRDLRTFWVSPYHNDFVDPGIYNLAISPDGEYIAVGTSGSNILLWNVKRYLKD